MSKRPVPLLASLLGALLLATAWACGPAHQTCTLTTECPYGQICSAGACYVGVVSTDGGQGGGTGTGGASGTGGTTSTGGGSGSTPGPGSFGAQYSLGRHFGLFGERAIAVRHAGGHVELSPIFGAQLHRDMLAVGWRPNADIDGDVEDRAAHDAQQLALG